VNIRKFIKKLQNLPDKQKNIILWIIVAILGIIMVFFWFNSATKRISKIGDGLKTIELPQIENQSPGTETQKDETADWKIYTNDKYGFGIRYPQGMELSEKPYSIYNYSIFEVELKKIKFLFSIKITKTKDLNYLLNIPEAKSIKEIIINGVTGEEAEYPSATESIINNAYFFEKGDETYVISAIDYNNLSESIDLYKKILSTFKFIQ